MRRERRRQVDADEGAERRLSARLLRRARSSTRASSASSATSPKASTSASSSSTRSWRWCRCCRSPRTSSSATRRPASASSTGTAPSPAPASCSALVGLDENPETLITNHRRRQAAAGRDRQGAVQEGQAADPRRADRQPEREGQRRAAATAARLQEAGHLVDPDLAQAQRDLEGRRPDHHPARRHHGRDARLPHATRSTRTASSRAWSGATWRTAIPPRDAARSASLLLEVRNWNAHHHLHADRPVVQEHQPHGPQGRDRRHRRPDGLGPDRARHEHLRPVLRPGHQRRGAARRQGRSTCRPSTRPSTAGIAYVTEDRKQLGLVLDENITKNTTLANLPGVSTATVIDQDKEYRRRERLPHQAATSAPSASSSRP